MSPTLGEGIFRGSCYPWAAPWSLILCDSGPHPPGHLPLMRLDESMEGILGFLGGASGKEPTCQYKRHQRCGFNPWVRKIPWRKAWQLTPVSCLENPMDRGAWWAAIYGVAQSPMRLKRISSSSSNGLDGGFHGGASGKEPTCQYRRHRRQGFNFWVRKIPWRRVWQPTPVFLPGEAHGQRSLVGYSSWDRRVRYN